MARPQRSRRVCEKPSIERFVPCSSSLPDGEKPGEPVLLTVDEYEVLRLVDLEGLTHSQCATQMNISRTTATEICESARRKVAAGARHRGRQLETVQREQKGLFSGILHSSGAGIRGLRAAVRTGINRFYHYYHLQERKHA